MAERRKSVNARKKCACVVSDDWRLTPSQIRELKSRLKDARDPTRFVIVSRFSRKFALYYNVSDATYAMNDVSAATLFKRRRAAEAVRKLLRGNACLLKVRLMKDGRIRHKTKCQIVG
ncbi:MAG: hypothetical protein HY274_09575 [Gammaproteobacteria bacterium]|nr:hypothetical protein [Gammaproteobacteria bacterium]